MLLVDTYDTLAAVGSIVRSGIKVSGIRLDSGDLYDLSVKSRGILDEAGYSSTLIMASGDLNEYIISDLVRRGAPIDVFGVGTELVTSRDDPALNGVYKLVAIRSHRVGEAGEVIYKSKTSQGKATYPGPKQVYRTVDQSSGTIKLDTVALDDEIPPENSSPLLQRYVQRGRLCTTIPTLQDIQKQHAFQVQALPAEFRRIDMTVDKFPVQLSAKLRTLAEKLGIF